MAFVRVAKLGLAKLGQQLGQQVGQTAKYLGARIRLEIEVEIGADWTRDWGKNRGKNWGMNSFNNQVCDNECLSNVHNTHTQTQVMQYTTDSHPEHKFELLEARPSKSRINWCKNKNDNLKNPESLKYGGKRRLGLEQR